MFPLSFVYENGYAYGFTMLALVWPFRNNVWKGSYIFTQLRMKIWSSLHNANSSKVADL
jgi:hypothetical protein